MTDINQLIKVYKDTISENIAEIDEVLLQNDASEVLDSIKIGLDHSSELITSKWLKGDKYIRTLFLTEIFQNKYPQERLGFSLLIDALINILDDLYDEDLTREVKSVYITEYLRAYSLFSHSPYSAEFHSEIGSYFNKLIALASAEAKYLDEIKGIAIMDEIVSVSTKLLMLRSRDIDIFTQIASKNVVENADIESLIQIFRNYRAQNILKKDIADIDRDIKGGQDTLVTYLHNMNGFSFLEYNKRMLEKFDRSHKASDELLQNSLSKEVGQNAYQALTKDRDEIMHLLEKK